MSKVQRKKLNKSSTSQAGTFCTTDSIYGSSTTHQPISELVKPRINYKDELVFYFYTELLPFIIDAWESVPPETPPDSDEESAPTVEANAGESSFSTCRFSEIATLKSNSKVASIPSSSTKKSTSSTLRESTTISIEDSGLEWFVEDTPNEYVDIKFANGNTYKGYVTRKVMEGEGTFCWEDGAVYRGEFRNGLPNGRGHLTYNELSTYNGEMRNGELNGNGAFFPSPSPRSQYTGQWKDSQFDGKGWLQYANGGYYEGEFQNGLKDGLGYQAFSNGSVYSGGWTMGEQQGFGIIHYCNKDFYRGDWYAGTPHGYGEYTWNASLNDGLALTMENIYQGKWFYGRRDGMGVMHFGMEGSKLAATFINNIKHGAGIVICGDGTVIEKNPLFCEDMPVHLQAGGGGEPSMVLRSPKPLKISASRRRQKSRSKNVIFSKASQLTDSFPTIMARDTPIEIPIHGSALTMTLSHHAARVIQAENERRRAIMQPTKSDEDLHIGSVVVSVEGEEEKVHKVLRKYYNYLEDTYNQYALIACPCQRVDFKPVLCRLYLWQFYRDIKVGLALTKIDQLLYGNADFAIETLHEPFEKIYFWQFIHSLLFVAHEIYDTPQYAEANARAGICATMFQTLISDHIEPNAGQYVGQCLFTYRNVAPVLNVYALYQSLGEQLTVKRLLKACCAPTHTECCVLKTTPSAFKRGINCVCTGTNLIYLEMRTNDFQRNDLPPYPFDEADTLNNDMHAFRILGAKVIINCLAKVCPLVVKDALLTNMDYELTFLEFYETLILMAEALFEYKQKVADEKLIAAAASAAIVEKTSSTSRRNTPLKKRKL